MTIRSLGPPEAPVTGWQESTRPPRRCLSALLHAIPPAAGHGDEVGGCIPIAEIPKRPLSTFVALFCSVRVLRERMSAPALAAHISIAVVMRRPLSGYGAQCMNSRASRGPIEVYRYPTYGWESL